jgi:hypothetical protein
MMSAVRTRSARKPSLAKGWTEIIHKAHFQEPTRREIVRSRKFLCKDGIVLALDCMHG